MEGNSDGETPLHAAAEYNDNPAVIEALLEVRRSECTDEWWRDAPASGGLEQQSGRPRSPDGSRSRADRKKAAVGCACEQGAWNTEAFFRAATVEDVTACLAAGRPGGGS